MTEAQKLYGLKLHETLKMGGVNYAMRVPGGFLYYRNGALAFVPKHAEFAPKNKKPLVFRNINLPMEYNQGDIELIKDERIRDQFQLKFPDLNVNIIIQKMLNWIERNKDLAKVKNKKNWVLMMDNWFLGEQEKFDYNKLKESNTASSDNYTQ